MPEGNSLLSNRQKGLGYRLRRKFCNQRQGSGGVRLAVVNGRGYDLSDGILDDGYETDWNEVHKRCRGTPDALPMASKITDGVLTPHGAASPRKGLHDLCWRPRHPFRLLPTDSRVEVGRITPF